ncbi:helix-turn-helix transcriptional regulator [Terrilactibacillus sp. S3-3]|nr:helix-turn-helix transcriptional regulator [Terrilactibacillus sp. S3-3]
MYLRVQKGMKAIELAAKLNVSSAYISHIERNQTGVSLETLEKICKVIGIPLNQFFFQTDLKPIDMSVIEAAKGLSDEKKRQLVSHRSIGQSVTDSSLPLCHLVMISAGSPVTALLPAGSFFMKKPHLHGLMNAPSLVTGMTAWTCFSSSMSKSLLVSYPRSTMMCFFFYPTQSLKLPAETA